jgi:hypothetical protein
VSKYYVEREQQFDRLIFQKFEFGDKNLSVLILDFNVLQSRQICGLFSSRMIQYSTVRLVGLKGVKGGNLLPFFLFRAFEK